MARLGGILAIVGALLLAVVIGNLVKDIGEANAADCKVDVANAPKGAMLYSAIGRFGANDKLCISWKPKVYFAQEVLARTEREEIVRKATEARDKAQAALDTATDTDRDAKKAALTTAQSDLDTAQSQLSALPTSAKVVLFIEDRATDVSFPASIPAVNDPEAWAAEGIKLRASEDHASDAAKAWREVLGGVTLNGSRPVKIGLGDPKADLPRRGATLEGLKVSSFETGWLVAGIVGFVLLMAGLTTAGWRTRMLRVRAPDSDTDQPIFSLARVQMFWWFALTLAGFLFIFLTTGQWMGVMTSAVVGLIGISSASGLAAVAIDTAPATGPTDAARNAQSLGFFKDILGDGQSIALHRVQMFAWTVVLGLIFVWTVLWRYTMPNFDATLLSLTGIVNGVYLGFKFPENKTTPVAPPADAAPAEPANPAPPPPPAT